MRKIIFNIILFAGLFNMPITANAANYTYKHNGSIMRIEHNGNQVEIFYDKPRSSLSSLGVRRGTLLFSGKVTDDYLEGMANIFSAKCGIIDYYVYGYYYKNTPFKLTGTWPKRDKKTCRIIDNVSTGSNAKLLFDPVKTRAAIPKTNNNCGLHAKTALNVRVGPGRDFARIGQITPKTCFVKIYNGACQKTWCPIEADANFLGWVDTRYLTR